MWNKIEFDLKNKTWVEGYEYPKNDAWVILAIPLFNNDEDLKNNNPAEWHYISAYWLTSDPGDDSVGIGYMPAGFSDIDGRDIQDATHWKYESEITPPQIACNKEISDFGRFLLDETKIKQIETIKPKRYVCNCGGLCDANAPCPMGGDGVAKRAWFGSGAGQ